MSKNRKLAAGRLYYTFGTVFLMAVITVCSMNFIQDSRLMNKPAVAAAKVNETGVAENTGSKTVANGKTADGKGNVTKDSEVKTAGTKPTGSGATKTKPTGTKPLNPGEEP